MFKLLKMFYLQSCHNFTLFSVKYLHVPNYKNPGRIGGQGSVVGWKMWPSLTQQTDVGLAGVAPPLPVLWGGNQHGFGGSRPIQVGSAVGERDTVVGAVDDQSVVLVTGIPQLLKDQPDTWRGTLRVSLPHAFVVFFLRL